MRTLGLSRRLISGAVILEQMGLEWAQVQLKLVPTQLKEHFGEARPERLRVGGDVCFGGKVGELGAISRSHGPIARFHPGSQAQFCQTL